MNNKKRIAVYIFLLLSGLIQSTSDSGIRQFDFGTDQVLHIALDPTWVIDFQAKARGDAELNLANPKDPKEKCRIYIIPQPKLLDKETVQAMLKENGAELLKRAVETELIFTPIASSNGFFYTLTDKEAKPGEPLLVGRGALPSPQHLILFTILFDTRDSRFFSSLIDSFGRARITAKVGG